MGEKGAQQSADGAAMAERLLDELAPLGDVTSKKMFGGYGFFKEGLMFALVADDRLYLKTDEENRPDFEALGAGPFIPDFKNSKRKPVAMPYHLVPDELLEDGDELGQWALKSIAAARRAKK